MKNTVQEYFQGSKFNLVFTHNSTDTEMLELLNITSDIINCTYRYWRAKNVSCTSVYLNSFCAPRSMKQACWHYQPLYMTKSNIFSFSLFSFKCYILVLNNLILQRWFMYIILRTSWLWHLNHTVLLIPGNRLYGCPKLYKNTIPNFYQVILKSCKSMSCVVIAG